MIKLAKEVLRITTTHIKMGDKFIENSVIRNKRGSLCTVQLSTNKKDGKQVTEYKNHPKKGAMPIFNKIPSENKVSLMVRKENRIKKEDNVWVRKKIIKGDREEVSKV